MQYASGQAKPLKGRTSHRIVQIRAHTGLTASLAGVIMLLCASATAEESHHHDHYSFPVGVVTLDAYRDGPTLHLLIGTHSQGDSALWSRRSEDSGLTWSRPARVDRKHARPFGIQRGNDARITARGRRLLAVWTVKGGGWGGIGPLAAAHSIDGGRTWQPAARPSDDGLDKDQGSTALVAVDDRVHAVWLDGRDGGQGLRFAHSRDNGMSWTRNQTIQARTCECCWNTLFAGPDGWLYALYRSTKPRDMLLARSHDQGTTWTVTGPVGAFNWDIDACFHAGGALAATANVLTAVVWTGREGQAGLHVLSSRDNGTSWAAEARLGDESAKHADLAAGAQSLCAVWDEYREEGPAVVLACRRIGATGWSVPTRLSAPRTRATHPRVLATPSGFLALWSEQATGAKPRVMRQLIDPLGRSIATPAEIPADGSRK
jgi:hypothetical protein